MPPDPATTTSCHLTACDDTAHVVVFATGQQFVSQPTTPGQRILLCLLHGGQLYDVIRAWRRRHSVSAPGWLVDDLKADRLPRVTPDRRWTARSRPRSRRHPSLREPR